jgi:cytochrome c
MNLNKLFAVGAGAILLCGWSGQLAAAAAQPSGDILFRQRCATCHQITAGKPSTVGPNLYGVVNRKAATAPVPFKYSEALKNSGLTWTRANLDKYLSAPAKMVPGTRMVIALPDAAQRAAVIDYLSRAK